MRDAVAATGRTVMMPSEYEAVNKGYLSTVKDMHSRGRLSDTRLLCAAAAASGQLEEFKALRAENFPWGKETCARPAKNGHLEVLKWARANGCPWDERTAARAASGHLEVLKWARENDCPWDRWRAARARGRPPRGAQVGARERLPLERLDVRGRSGGGHFEVLKWRASERMPVG